MQEILLVPLARPSIGPTRSANIVWAENSNCKPVRIAEDDLPTETLNLHYLEKIIIVFSHLAQKNLILQPIQMYILLSQVSQSISLISHWWKHDANAIWAACNQKVCV
jgi:hypothetical protein